jgi:hypothetical protein
VVQLLVLSPFGKVSWTLVDALSEAAQAKYWSDVVLDWIYDSEVESNEGVERLLKAHRPARRFRLSGSTRRSSMRKYFPACIKMMVAGNEKPGEYMLQHYGVEKAFRHLNASPLLTLEQKAGLEFAFLEALAQPWDRHSSSYGIPNLERYVEAHPEMFVQALAWAYKRKDGALDPAKFQAL